MVDLYNCGSVPEPDPVTLFKRAVDAMVWSSSGSRGGWIGGGGGDNMTRLVS